MSRLVEGYESIDFELGDRVSFISPWGERIIGEVVRVYNTRTLYHVLVDDQRYEVDYEDEPRKED